MNQHRRFSFKKVRDVVGFSAGGVLRQKVLLIVLQYNFPIFHTSIIAYDIFKNKLFLQKSEENEHADSCPLERGDVVPSKSKCNLAIKVYSMIIEVKFSKNCVFTTCSVSINVGVIQMSMTL